METHDEVPPPGHEQRDFDPRSMLAFGIFLMAGVVIAAIIAYGVVYAFSRVYWVGGPARSPLAEEVLVPPGPRLQPMPEGDLEWMLRREELVLESYGWVNPQQGTMRIPIERAMELVLERGLPVSPGQAAPGAGRMGPVPAGASATGGGAVGQAEESAAPAAAGSEGAAGAGNRQQRR